MHTRFNLVRFSAKSLVWSTALWTLCSCSTVPSEDTVHGFVYNVLHGWQQNQWFRKPGDTSIQGPCYKGPTGYDDYKKARESLRPDSESQK
jgi:hypothetical protein